MFGLRRGEFDKTYEAFLNCVHPEDRKSVTDAVDENGNVWNWGDNTRGPLGGGPRNGSIVPVQVRTFKLGSDPDPYKYFDENYAFGHDGENIDAVHVLANRNIVLSCSTSGSLKGIPFEDEDLIEYNPAGETASMFFDGDTHGLTSDIDAVHGSTRQLMDSAGTTVDASYSYDAYDVMLGGNPILSVIRKFGAGKLHSKAGKSIAYFLQIEYC